MKLSRTALALAFLAAATPSTVQALAVCTVSATPVSFGSYDPLAPSPRTSTGSVTVSCDLILGIALLVAYNIGFSQGNSGSYTNRQLKAGPAAMTYNLYTNSTHSNVWGDGGGGSSVVGDGYLLGLFSSRNYTVYGRIPALQNVPAGNYSDTIIVTVTY